MNQNFSSAEINKFSDLAAQWWDQSGPCKPLHDINPVRLEFIKKYTPLKGLKIADIGCGGGILSEAIAKEGAEVTGIDLSAEVISVAKLHSKESQLDITYHTISIADFTQQNSSEFDVIVCMELLEHVPDPQLVFRECAKLIKPEGFLFFSTINRNWKAYLFAVLGAEYLLKLLPPGTHDYDKFIRPSELDIWARQSGLELIALSGMSYNLLSKAYSLTQDVDVNYLACYQKN